MEHEAGRLLVEMPTCQERAIIPVFIAYSISDSDIRKISHDSLSGRVHEIESSSVIGFLEAILGTQPSSVSVNHLQNIRNTSIAI